MAARPRAAGPAGRARLALVAAVAAWLVVSCAAAGDKRSLYDIMERDYESRMVARRKRMQSEVEQLERTQGEACAPCPEAPACRKPEPAAPAECPRLECPKPAECPRLECPKPAECPKLECPRPPGATWPSGPASPDIRMTEFLADAVIGAVFSHVAIFLVRRRFARERTGAAVSGATRAASGAVDASGDGATSAAAGTTSKATRAGNGEGCAPPGRAGTCKGDALAEKEAAGGGGRAVGEASATSSSGSSLTGAAMRSVTSSYPEAADAERSTSGDVGPAVAAAGRAGLGDVEAPAQAETETARGAPSEQSLEDKELSASLDGFEEREPSLDCPTEATGGDLGIHDGHLSENTGSTETALDVFNVTGDAVALAVCARNEQTIVRFLRGHRAHFPGAMGVEPAVMCEVVHYVVAGLAALGGSPPDLSTLDISMQFNILRSIADMCHQRATRTQGQTMEGIATTAVAVSSAGVDEAARANVVEIRKDAEKRYLQELEAFRRRASDALSFGMLLSSSLLLYYCDARGLIRRLVGNACGEFSPLRSSWLGAFVDSVKRANWFGCALRRGVESLFALGLMALFPAIAYRIGIFGTSVAKAQLTAIVLGLGFGGSVVGSRAVGLLGGDADAWKVLWWVWVVVYVGLSRLAEQNDFSRKIEIDTASPDANEEDQDSAEDNEGATSVAAIERKRRRMERVRKSRWRRAESLARQQKRRFERLQAVCAVLVAVVLPSAQVYYTLQNRTGWNLPPELSLPAAPRSTWWPWSQDG